MHRLRLEWMVALTAALMTSGGLVFGHETDNYSVPLHQEFADLGPLFDQIFYRNLTRAVEEVNDDIERAVRFHAPQETLASLQSPPTITRAVRRAFPPTLSMIDDIERLLNSKQARRQYPGQVTAYKAFSCIYNHSSFVLDPRQVFKLWRASTVRIGDTYMGTDKIGHFLSKGYINYDLYVHELEKHGDRQRAMRSTIELGTGDHFFYSEKRMVGYFSSGVFSNADLAADYVGLLFYRNLTEEVSLGGQTRPAMLVRRGDFWELAPYVQDGTNTFTAFVSGHFDEVLNPNLLEPMMRSAVRRAIEDLSPRLLERYTDEMGNRRSRAWFEALMHEYSTLHGMEYGHDRKWDDMITVSNTCLAPFDYNGDVTARSPRGRTALHEAAASGELARIDQTLASGAAIDAPIRSQEIWSSQWGDTPLHTAAGEGQLDAVGALIAAGANLGAQNDNGVTPVHRAAAHPAVLALLLEKGAAADRADHLGRTPLHWAAGYGQSDAAAQLIAAGAQIEGRDHRGQTPLHYAATFGRTQAMATLLDAGADVNARADLGLTPLHAAVQRDQIAVVELLLARGADANGQDEFGCTPLHDAAARNRLEAVRILLAGGASAAARDAYGSTPLHEAARRGNERVAAALLEHGASIDDVNDSGRTPLHEAAANGHTAAATLLQAHGADMNRRDRAGKTPAQLAAQAEPSLVERFTRLGELHK